MSDSQRITNVISHYKMSTESFGRYIGMKQAQSLRDVIKGRNGISKNIADHIKAKCLDIDMNWLLTGEGEMLKQDKNSVSSPPVEHEKLPAGTGMIEFMMEQNRSLEKIVHDQNKIMIDNNELIKNLHTRISELEVELDRAKNASTAHGKDAGCVAAS